MTVRFARLRIAGFKSFADPVTVEILPGLTGIVGPNGCGKSNVVEALRWVMGESSARSLRGGEMDDLIFAGTATRPARTLAEVTLTLEGTKGFGPQGFAELDELQISRRAERGAGSDYRINGRSIRARDVQTLFADLASGARSSAMVSQGRVAMLVGARPEERRGILEEAAGITGLHARRHEAELKLRATESNLTRAEDRRKQLSERLGELADQSREAEQYRALSAALREAETELLALLHARARQAVQRAADTVAQARLALSSREEAAETAVMAEFERRRRLPALREQADTARTALERCRVLAEGTAREEERAVTLAREASERLAQHEADLQAATNRLTDARSALERTQAEQAEIEAATATLPTRQEEAAARQEVLRLELDSIERDLAALTETLNTARAHHTRAVEELENARARHSLSTQALSAIEGEVAELEAALPSDDALQAIAKTAESTALAAQQARATADESERLRAQRAMEVSVARSQAEAARQAQTEQKENIAQARQRLDSLAKAMQQAETRRAEAMAALLSPETLAHLRATENSAAQAAQHALAALETAEQARLQADTVLNESSRAAHEAEARHRNAAETLRTAEAALSRARQEEQVLAQELEKARAEAMPDSVLEEARQARMVQENSLQQISQLLEQAEQALPARREALTASTARRTTLQTELTRLHAQAEGLDHALDEEEPQAGNPVSAQLSVDEQYEAALAAALADGLDASTTETAVRGWRLLAAEAPPPLPPGTTPLKALVSAPPELERILTFTGLVSDTVDAITLLPHLTPGQCLVSRAGDLWRWDGFYARATATGGAARRLAQRRILRETRARIAALQADEPALEQAVQQAAQAVQETESAIARLRGERATVERALQQARTQESETGRRHAASRARLDTIQPQQERATAARLEAEAAHTRAQETHAALPPVQGPRDALQAAQQTHASAQAAEQEARTQLRQAQARLQTTRDERASSEQTHAAAQARLDTLTPECARLREAHASEQAAFDVLAQRLATIEADQQAAQALEAATQALHEAEQTARQALEQARLARLAADSAASENQRSRERAADLRGRLAGLTPRMAELRQSHVDATEQVARAEKALQAAAIPAETEQTLDQLRARRQDCQTQLDATREERAALLAENTALATRRAATQAALADWTARAETASREEESIRLRMQDVRSEHERVSSLPDAARQQKQQTQQNLTEAEAAHAAADKARTAAEDALTQAGEQRQKAEGELSTAREALLKAEGRSEQARAILDQLLAESPPPARPPSSDLTEAAEGSLRRKITRLTHERDAMGPVNLRAELEAREATTQAETLATEMADLEAAISRLRSSIGSLNQEGRERLMAVFAQVDQHFQSLFTRMFGGGRAHLGLVGSDDPLEAGLEIYAQPPGKKLATLSLLSGGEQALTALSLIFSVFRCNPAPVCVLDEVDAPLDDANVGRFSTLLTDMVSEAGTRFLVVTHHQLTMAYMDQLFGVTMQERGVSRVLSVDLAKAASMVGQNDKEAPHVAS